MPLHDSGKAADARSVCRLSWCRSIPVTARAPALIPRDPIYLGWTFKGPRALTPSRPGAAHEPRALIMDIPLDLERRFERRWAARFCRPAAPAAPQSQPQQQQVSEPAKAKRKTRRVKAAGLRSAPVV